MESAKTAIKTEVLEREDCFAAVAVPLDPTTSSTAVGKDAGLVVESLAADVLKAEETCDGDRMSADGELVLDLSGRQLNRSAMNSDEEGGEKGVPYCG